MRLSFLRTCFPAWVVFGCGVSFAGAPAAPASALSIVKSDTLDLVAVQAEYADGNFEALTQALEAYRAPGRTLRIRDSVILCKYLGVIYTANPATREKGKYWLYKLLENDPRADIVDLFVSDEIKNTFDRVRLEFVTRRHYRGLNDFGLARQLEKDTLVVRDTVVLSKPDSQVTREESGGLIPMQRWKNPRSWTWNLNLSLGKKFMEKAWVPVNEQTEMRLALDVRQARWPVNVAFDFLYSYSLKATKFGTDSSYAGRSAEILVGVRKIWDRRFFSMRPYNGAGLSYSTSALKADYWPGGEQRPEPSWGLWLQGGVYWELEKHLNLGLDFTYSFARVLLFDEQVNAGGLHSCLLLGFHY